MDPRDFQILAKKLVAGTNPAEVRTAISRAYYAAFNCAVAILEELGFRINTGSSGHGEVRNRLSNSGDNDLKKVGSQLADLQNKRIQADYRLKKTDIENQKTAQATVQQVDRLIQVLDECLREPRRQRVIEAIQKWERITSSIAK